MSSPWRAKLAKSQGGSPIVVRVHGGSPVALENTPTFAARSQRSPVHNAPNTAIPGRKRSVPSKDADQSVSPGSRKNAVPLNPPPASNREGLPAIISTLEA